MTQAECTRLADRFHPATVICSSQAALKLAQLPSAKNLAKPASSLPETDDRLPAGELWRDLNDWHRHEQQQDDQRSIGWKIHPGQIFSFAAVRDWLRGFSWQRAKGVLHTDQGWLALNGLDGADPDWRPSGWRRDNRLEIIAVASLDCPTPPAQELESTLRTTLTALPAHDPESCT